MLIRNHYPTCSIFEQFEGVVHFLNRGITSVGWRGGKANERNVKPSASAKQIFPQRLASKVRTKEYYYCAMYREGKGKAWGLVYTAHNIYYVNQLNNVSYFASFWKIRIFGKCGGGVGLSKITYTKLPPLPPLVHFLNNPRVRCALRLSHAVIIVTSVGQKTPTERPPAVSAPARVVIPAPDRDRAQKGHSCGSIGGVWCILVASGA